jgi:serine/threonine protein kinase
MSGISATALLQTPSIPIIEYVGSQERVRLTGESRDSLLQWWSIVKNKPPFDCLVVDKDSKRNCCQLRVKLVYLYGGETIFGILEKAGLVVRNRPALLTIDDILRHRKATYSINGCEYQIQSLISDAGSWGDVFLAYDRTNQRQAAIKVLKDEEDAEDTMLSRLQSRGGHPNIVKFFGSAIIERRKWVAMEYIEGTQLGGLDNLTPEMMKQYRSALKYMRKCGVPTHRENERENVLVTVRDGLPSIVLIDFGTLAY